MKKLLIIFSLFFSLTSMSQGIEQAIGPAHAITLDSLYTHVGKEDQPLLILGRHSFNDGFGGWYVYKPLLTTPIVPYLNFPILGREDSAGRWVAIQTMTTSGGDTSVFSNPDFLVLDILTTPPSTPATGDIYLAGFGSAGDWLNQDWNIEEWTGSTWQNTVPEQGQLLINGANSHMYKYTGTEWIDITTTLVLNDGGNDYGFKDLSAGNWQNKAFWLMTNHVIVGGFDSSGAFYAFNVGDDPSPDSVLTIVNGQIMKTAFPTSGSSATASEGLHAAGSDIRLGGTLTGDTTIDASTNMLTVTGSNSSSPLRVTSTSGSAASAAIYATSDQGFAGRFLSNNAVPLSAETNIVTNSIQSLLKLYRFTAGTATSGLGGSIDFEIENSTGGFTTAISNALKSEWTSVTAGSETSQFTITGINAGTTATLFTLGGNGRTSLNKYGVGSFTSGSLAYNLGVDASGNIMEVASGGGTSIVNTYVPLIKSGDTISTRFNVLHYGADNTGVNDATTAIQNAINAANAAGGGTVLFPLGSYKISGALTANNCQIDIPTATGATRANITLQGESAPSTIPVGGGLPSSNTTIAATGVRLISSLTTGASGAAVIGTASTLNNITIKNIAIQVKNNPAGAGPVVGGINLANGYDCLLENVSVYIDTSGEKSTFPTNNISGIETPNNSLGANYILNNCYVIGFKNGYKLGEHVTLNSCQAFCCYYGINWKTGGHASQIINTSLQWNLVDIYFTGSVPLLPSTFSQEYEFVGHSGGKWYDNAFTIKDSANLGTGSFIYKSVAAGGTPASAAATKSGGANLYLYRQDSTNYALLNRPTNTFNSGSGGSVIETNSSGTSNGFKISKSGTGLWALLNETYGVADKSFNIYSYKLGRPTLWMDSTGIVNIGGSNPSAASSSNVSISAAGVVTIPGSLGIGSSPTTSLHIKKDFTSGWGQFAIQAVTGTGNGATIYQTYYDGVGTRLMVMGLGHYSGGSDPNYYFANEISSGGIKFRNSSADIVTIDNGGKTFIGGSSSPTSTLHVGGSFAGAYVAKSADYTATISDYVIEVTATGKTITLPTAVSITGRIYTIKLTASSATGTVATTSSQTIDGSTTYSLSAQYKYVTVQSNGANWIIIGNN